MKVLITGAAGNLGKVITQHLISRNIPVIGIDTNNHMDHSSDNFKYYKCSITEEQKMNNIFEKEQPSNVIHLAATFNRVRNRKTEMEIDVGGSENVLKISNKIPSVKQLIYSSSAAAYGGHKDNPLWLNEDHELRPGNYRYGIIKKMVESIYFGANTRKDLNIVSLRICSVVGPSFNKKRCAISILINSKYLLEQWKQNKIQLLHEDDFNHLIFNILKDGKIHGKYNLAPDSFSQINELVQEKKYIKIPLSMILIILWVLWYLRILNLRPASLKQSIYPIVLSPTKLISTYFYKFKYSSEEAFQATLKYCKTQDNKRFNSIPSSSPKSYQQHVRPEP
ncbi:NAD-dependent epimerase/dehydratase family protein [Yeosuana sp. MJ-SS3]|jgi:UDP-glucose 4-epimerase|uniref:NAD-dependent epimerase/dehydratase family protein n=1 Tax=Gilvirhabdus luticola TaxID=3079858 RepID=A0ABU3U7U9_9FLAO|nr:NAD-dependent epimerase/dehydratase family protein [Yeosuana sp. MJ-SS3]MDU8886407.1 NAD-dependent epimerase/dehydratase family protein [Yeosuana sp. MJ-SS3]